MILALEPNMEWVKRQTGILKLLTATVNLICISLLVDYALSSATSRTSSYFLPVTSGGFLLVDIFLIVSYTLDDNLGKAPIQELVVAGLGAIFCLSAGSIAINATTYIGYVYTGAGIIYGILCFINTVLYSLAIYFHMREGMQPATTYQEVP